LGLWVIYKVHDNRNKGGVLGRTLLLEPFAQTADRSTSCLAYTCVGILQAGLDHRPYLVHEGSHKLRAAFNGHAESKKGSPTVRGIRRREVLLDEGTKGREDLSWREVGSQAINNTESRLL
jgi:hypothetical protein